MNLYRGISKMMLQRSDTLPFLDTQRVAADISIPVQLPARISMRYSSGVVVSVYLSMYTVAVYADHGQTCLAYQYRIPLPGCPGYNLWENP